MGAFNSFMEANFLPPAAKIGSQKHLIAIRDAFSCLLSVGNRNRDCLINEFRNMNDTAHECGMEVILDVAPPVFEALGAYFDHLACKQRGISFIF